MTRRRANAAAFYAAIAAACCAGVTALPADEPPRPVPGVVPKAAPVPAPPRTTAPAPTPATVPSPAPTTAPAPQPATGVGPAPVMGTTRGTAPVTYVVSQRHAQASDDSPGTEEEPLKTIAAAATRVKAGDTVLIRGGVYREKVVIDANGAPDKPITFQAAAGEHVVVTGADAITNWKKEDAGDNVFSTDWPHSFINWTKDHIHPNDDHHLLIGRAEQVFMDGYLLRQVLRRDRMERGTFFVDLDAKKFYVWSADNRDVRGRGSVEASARNVIWDCQGSHVRVRGIRFRYAANRAQEAAAQFKGANSVIEDCVFEKTNSIGAGFFGDGSIVRRCVFQDNGQMGFGIARAQDVLMTGCLCRNNNTKGYSRGWEAGGNKIVLARRTVLENSMFLDNRGNGIWFDIGNEDCVVRNCLIANNEDAGIFYEISFGLHAHDNVIVGNGLADSYGAWGASAGISISSSPNCVIERNLIVGNKEGFNFREQTRRTPLIGKPKGAEVWVWNHDQVVRNNVLAYNRDAQTWGWFDIRDARHWPAEMQEQYRPAEKAGAKADIAKDYQAKKDEGAPTGLSLEKLKITFQGNLYHAAPGQGLFNWGCTWHKHRKYTSLDDVRKELRLADGCREAKVLFSDLSCLDLRVPADSPAIKMGCYPKGDVPGVKLGIVEHR